MDIYDTRLFSTADNQAQLVIYYSNHISTYDLIYIENHSPYTGQTGMESRAKTTWSLGNPAGGVNPDIAIASAIVSRRHGQIICSNGHWYYMDHENKNGTFYNGEFIKEKDKPILLKQGDILRIDNRDLDAVDRRGVLILFLESSADGTWTHYPLQNTTTRIGRNPSRCQIVLGKPYISGQHAQITQSGHDCYLQDLGSLAGTFMNGNEIQGAVKLRERDSFSICGYYFIFSDNELIFNAPSDYAGQADRRSYGERKNRDGDLYGKPSNDPNSNPNNNPNGDPNINSYNGLNNNPNPYNYRENQLNRNGYSGNNPDGSNFNRKNYDLASHPVILRADIKTRKVKSNTGFGEKELIRNIRLDIRRGSLVALLGTAGAGKSTVMNCLNGMDIRGVEGTVMFKNVDLTKHFNQMSSLIGSVPQQKVFHPTFTPEEEFRFAAIMRLPGDTSKQDIERRVDETIHMLKMDGVRHNQNIKLSGGEQSRVNLGIELVADRELLCLDEPDAGLSPDLKRQLVHILRDLAHDYDKSVLTIIHDVSDINLFDQVIILVKHEGVGRLAFSGTPEEAKQYFGCDVRDVYELLSKDPGKYVMG